MSRITFFLLLPIIFTLLVEFQQVTNSSLWTFIFSIRLTLNYPVTQSIWGTFSLCHWFKTCGGSLMGQRFISRIQKHPVIPQMTCPSSYFMMFLQEYFLERHNHETSHRPSISLWFHSCWFFLHCQCFPLFSLFICHGPSFYPKHSLNPSSTFLASVIHKSMASSESFV